MVAKRTTDEIILLASVSQNIGSPQSTTHPMDQQRAMKLHLRQSTSNDRKHIVPTAQANGSIRHRVSDNIFIIQSQVD